MKWTMFHIERRNAEVKISSYIILYYIYTFRYFLSFVVVPCIDLMPKCSSLLHIHNKALCNKVLSISFQDILIKVGRPVIQTAYINKHQIEGMSHVAGSGRLIRSKNCRFNYP